MGEFVIQVFEPVRTQPSRARRARVFMLPGSEPASGSVRPKQPTSSPVASRGSHLWRCASLPYAWIGNMTRLPWTLPLDRTLGQCGVADGAVLTLTEIRSQAMAPPKPAEVEALVTLREQHLELHKQDAQRVEQDRLDEVVLRQWIQAKRSRK